MTAYGISPASVCGNIRARSWENSRSLPTCSADSPIPRTCPGSLSKVLRLARGRRWLLHAGARRALRGWQDKLGVFYLTELENAAGRPEKVCSWLKKTSCVQVTCESKSDWKRPTELINVRKVCSDTSVPRMKLVEFEAGYPPDRRFQLEQ